MPFNLFGPSSKDDIRVGYISTERGFVDGVSVCQANDYAKKNPGSRFIFRTRDQIKYIGINDVNKLNADDLLPLSAQEKNCPGVQLESECGPSQVYFYGGGGVGAKANPVIGKDGALLAVDLVSGGFGYQYPPVTEVKDNCGIGAGSVVRSVLGEVSETVEYYDQEEDFEVYDICSPTESGYGRQYSPDGKDIGEWDPTLYANLSKDPIRKEIKAYQDFLSTLKGGYRVNILDNIVYDWWTTRKETPLSVTSSNRTTRVKHDVRHPGWGGEYGSAEFKEVTFKVFTNFGKKENPLIINFSAEDNSHKFSIRADSFENNTRGQNITVKVRTNVPYKISSQGNYKGKGTEVGLIDKIGRKSEEKNTKDTNKVLKGNSIFADFLESPNDNDDLQVEATVGQFSATRSGTGKGRTTYNLKYELNDGAVYKPAKIDDSFMNNHAISPVPPSNVSGSDFAGTIFTMEWEKDFPYSGDYVFKGMSDNIGSIYLDNQLLFKTTEFRKNMPPTKVKKKVESGVHRIRVDLYNVPITEKKITSTTSSSGKGLDIVYKGLNSKNKTLNVKDKQILLKDGDGEDTNSTFSIVSSETGVNARFSSDGKRIEYDKDGKITVKLEWNDNPQNAGVAVESITVGNKKLVQKGTSGSQKETITVTGSQSNNNSSSTQSESQIKNIFNTIDYINKANRKLWRTNVYNRGGFINEYGVCPFDTNVQLEDNPYAGTHKIIWDNIDFPVDGNYVIELEVDDNVTLTFNGPQENVVITKKGFSSPTKSTGKTTETKYFKKGKYKITADLQQIPGGRFGFDDATKGINPMALAINITSSILEQEVISAKSWNENPMGVALTIDAPLPPIPQEPIVQQEGRCPKNPIWTTRYPSSTEKWYPVNFSSPRTVTETISNTTPESSNTQEVDFTVYGQGAFKDLSFIFTSVTGNHTFTLKGVDKNKKTRTEKIKILKNTNYVVYAKEDSKKYKSVEQGLIKGGTKAKEQGIGESKKIFADYTTTQNDNDDIQITASSGTFKSSNKRKAPSSGRNTYDLVYRLDGSPAQKSETSSSTKTYQVPGWSKFMNRYAISPIPPLAQDGSDGAGIVYRNSWNVDIPYDGFYALKGTVDNIGRVLIDGQDISGAKNFKSPYRFRQGIPDPDPGTLGIPAINNAFSDGLTSADILVEAAKQGLKINPNAQPLLKSGYQKSRTSSGTVINLQSFGEENPKSTKIFLTKGRHTIQVEVENQKVDTFKTIDKKIFNTADWVVQQTTKTVSTNINAKFVQKDGKYYLEVTGNGTGEIMFVMDVNDSSYIAGVAASEVIIPSDSKKIKFTRKGNSSFGSAFGLSSYYEEKETIKQSGTFTAGKTYGPIEIIGATSGVGKPVVSGNRLGLLDADGSDENIKITIAEIKNSSNTQSSGGLSGGTVKDDVTYSGPTLASYKSGTLGPFLTPTFTTDEDYRTNNMDKTWISKWFNVDFPETGQYEIKAEADDYVIIRIDGEKVAQANVFEGVKTFNANVTKGKRTVELEFYNIPGNNRSTFESNPVVFNVIITKKVSVSTNIGQPWTSNPMGVSAILIPPPCPKLIKGKGVIKEVIVEDPGNGNPAQVPGLPTIPVGLRLKSVQVVSPGINYNCGVDQIQITPNNGAILDYKCDTFGRISEVIVVQGGFGFTTYPEITMPSETGINVEFRPILEPIRDPIVSDPEKLIQVTDLVGLKQTGYVDGRAYYGAVFYKDGIRYAGFYETPGELVQIYDTLQESIDAKVTTPPSAILRQGTDTNSNNPRLNIPGTPENLI